jgi:hypothetical protein
VTEKLKEAEGLLSSKEAGLGGGTGCSEFTGVRVEDEMPANESYQVS